MNKRTMTDQEFNRLKAKIGVYKKGKNYNVKVNGHGTGLKPPTEADWQRIRNLPVLVNNIQKTSGGLKAAASHDNSATIWFPPIGNQDGEGSCVAWAEGYYVKTFQEAREHNWNLSSATWEGGYDGEPSSAYKNKIFSPDFIYHQINDGADEGASFNDAMDLLDAIGCCTWDVMPYNPSNSTSWPSEAAWRQAPLYRSDSGYSYMWVTEASDLEELKTILENQNCVTIPVNADEYNDMTNDDLWTYNNYSGAEINHANTIVGYDDNYGPYYESGTSNNYGAFKVANSWGEGDWENDADGFYFISYKAMMQRVEVIFSYDNKVNYLPQLLAVFNIAHNNRGDCNITLGIGETSSPTRTKKMDDFISQGGARPYPANNMAFDITEFVSYMNNTADKFFLNVHDGSNSQTGEINSFSVEKYTNYLSGTPVNTYYSNDTPLVTRNNANNYVTILTSEAAATIQLDPDQFELDWGSGELSIIVNCNGSGDLPWNASVTSGSSWLTITSGASGNGTGIVVADYDANLGSSLRSGTIEITASWASNSPQQAQIAQASREDFITVTSPNGGENWLSGSNHNITWLSAGGCGTVKIELSTNNGLTWTTLSASTANDGSFPWVIPSTVSTNCLIRISCTDGSLVDQSDGVFTITSAQEITVTSPNGGEVWQAGDNQHITWNSSNTSGTVNIDYSTNNGSSWNRILSSVADDGSHSWLVPNTPSSNCKIKVTDTDGNPSDQSNNIFTISPCIEHFTFNETEDYYPVLIQSVTLDEGPVSTGDEVGVFASDGQGGQICAGATVIYGNPPYSIQAWGDDSQTNEKDGFTNGEILHFRLWDSSAQTEFAPESNANYTSGNGTWGNGALAQINPLQFRTSCDIILNLASGWNWISANVAPNNPAMSSTWASVSGLNIVKGMTGFYIPGTINSIGNWNVYEMYQVNLQSAKQLILSGDCIAANTPISLIAGWNWVSYLPETPINAETALASIAGKLGIVKARDGFYIPGKMNSIGNMVPGAGYKLYLNQAGTLTYPQASNNMPGNPIAGLAKTIPVHGKHYTDIQPSHDYQAIVITNIKTEELSAGAEIGVFTTIGLCVGSAIYTGQLPMAITAWADDPQTDLVEGCQQGDVLQFKLWDPVNKNEMTLQHTLLQGGNEYGTSAFSEVELQLAATENIPADLALEPNYPNPFNPITTIHYGLPADDVVTIRVYDILGKQVQTLINAEKQTAGWHSYELDASHFASGLYFYQLQTSQSQRMGKMMLVK